MATGNKLEVQIGADITDLKQGVNDAVIALEKLRQQKAANLKVGLDVTALNAQIATAKKNLSGLQKQFSATAPAVDKLAKSTANGSNALMQFSRIAQDAPYGIIGIGNNITATAESFSYLKAQTGSTGGALKALGSSLMGTGGILLGVSLLTTGFTLLAQSGLSVGDIIDKMTGNFDEFGESIKKASEEGAKAASNEIFGLKALVSASQNKALSDKDRLIAVNELQKQYPGYFGNLSKEQIMTSNLTGVVNELTSALLNRAIAEKLASASADIQLKVFAANAKLVKQKNETIRLEQQLATLRAGASNDDLYADNKKFIAVTNLNGLIRNSKRAEDEARLSIIAGTKSLEQRQNVINQLTASSIKLSQTAAPKSKATSPIGSTPQVTGLVSNLTPAPLVIPAVDTTIFAASLKSMAPMISESTMNMQLAMMDFSEKANDLISGAITSSFISLGEMIGNSMAGADGGLSTAGERILGIIGGFLTEFGKLMITTGIGLVIAKKAMTSGNGYAMIAGGVAMVAIGAAFSASSKKAQKSTGDSIGGGSTSSSTGSGANTNASFSGGSGFSGGMNGGTVVFEIAGTSLIGVLNNTTARNLRIGGR